MSKYVILNPAHGGSDKGNVGSTITESEYTLKMAQEMSRYFNELGIANMLIRTTDSDISDTSRIKSIVSNTPNTKDTVVLTLNFDSPTNLDTEIIYALRNTDKLASRIATDLEEGGYSVSKFYQRRLPSDTSKDYDNFIRETGNREAIRIDYGNLTQEDFIKNNWQNLARITAKAIATYLGEVGNYYVVQAGDSLYAIARRFGVTVEEIKKANNLGTDFLSVGQRLLIPEKQPEETVEPDLENIYIVKKGDTLYGIARAYGISVEELKKRNQLTTNLLNVGQKLILPMEKSKNTITYEVKAGDSLYSIAVRYGVSVEELKQANNLNSNLLSIGKILIIPLKTEKTTYLVEKGDTLYSIAKKYHVSVDSLIEENRLTTTVLSIGQKLMIPNI